MLKTVQITIPRQLLVKIDQAAAELKTSRSGLAQMAQQDAEAYARQPQDPDEIVAWESVQDWGDA